MSKKLKLNSLKVEQKRFIKNLSRSQKAQFRNTELLKCLERKRELFLCDSLPGLKVIYNQKELKEVNTEIKKLLKYLIRSQKAILRNTRKISRIEKKIRLLTAPKLIGLD